MTDQINQNIDFSEAEKPSSFMEREIEKQSATDAAQVEQEFTREQEAENKVSHEQNITAHVPGGSTIADVDK